MWRLDECREKALQGECRPKPCDTVPGQLHLKSPGAWGLVLIGPVTWKAGGELAEHGRARSRFPSSVGLSPYFLSLKPVAFVALKPGGS